MVRAYKTCVAYTLAGVAELVDAHGSGPCEGNFVEVRVLSPAQFFLHNI